MRASLDRKHQSTASACSPPRVPLIVLSSLLHVERRHDVLGDLEEHFRQRVAQKGLTSARVWYWRQVIAFASPALRERVSLWQYALTRRKPKRHTHQANPPQPGFRMSRLPDEFRHALRHLARSPGFSLVSAATLAIGIAANTAIFSLVYSVVLHPLPFPEPDRLVTVGHTAPGLDLPEVEQAYGTHLIYRDDSETFDDLAAAQPGTQTLTGAGEPERLRSARVTAGFFNTLRVQPILGRPIADDDCVLDAPPVVILSHGLWSRRFGSDPAAIGQSIYIGSIAVEIIGIAPPGFAFPGEDTDLWLPYQREPNDFGGFHLNGFGRLKRSAVVAQANADLQRLIPTIPERFPDFTAAVIENSRLGVVVTPLKETVVGNIKQTLWILLGAVGIVLLVACANVANLFLVRAEAQQREIAVRAALGAGRSTIMRHYLTEAATLAGFGGMVGVFLAWLGIRTLVSLAPAGIPRLSEVGLNLPVLAFAAAISILSGLFFGAFPIMKHAAPDIASILKEGGRGTSAGRTRHRVRHLLVVAQIAFALVLLVGSGLMARSFQKLRHVEPGFDPANALTFRVSLPDAEYPDRTSAFLFHQALTDRLNNLPGVVTVGSVDGLPLSGSGFGMDPLFAEDQPLDPGVLPPIVHMSSVNPGYFTAIGIPLLAGRVFEPSDALERTGAVLVSRALADRYWPDEDPIGKRVYPGIIDNPAWYTVVGVVGDVYASSLRGESTEVVYLPPIGTNGAEWWSAHSMAYVIRTSVPPLSLAATVRSTVWDLNPSLPIARLRTMEQIVDDSMMQTEFAMLLIAIAAAVALILGTVGIYAVIAYIVGQRTGEIGIRIALGAQPEDVSRMILGQGSIVALAGVVLGLLGSLGLMHLLGALLFDVSPTDPLTYAAVVLLLLAVALLASYLPARRAAAVDPVDALRAEL